MKRHGFVEVTNNDTTARCTRCGKSLTYQQPMRVKMWKEVLKAFIRKHKECGGE